MFSEYASRFLARSTLKDGGRQSLYPASNAPLFFSAADYPTDDREHDQEVSAIYALQKSRRNLYYSTDPDEEEERNDSDTGSVNDGIRSSWNPGRSAHSSSSDATETGGNHLVDVSLGEEELRREGHEGTLLNSAGRVDSYSEASREVEDPIHPPIQKFRPQNVKQTGPFFDSTGKPYSDQNDEEAQNNPHEPLNPSDPFGERDAQEAAPSDTIPQPVDQNPLAPPLHDRIWTKLYGMSMACMFATAFVVWLHNEEPSGLPIGDSIYTVLRRAMPLLAVDTLVTICVAFVWMLCLKYFIKPLLYLLVVSVPAVMIALTIYPLVTSLKGPWKGNSFQDHVMRLTSLLPLCLAIFWVYLLYRGRQALHKATSILQLALTIFVDNPALVFLNGRSTMIGGVPVWQMDGSGWVLGSFFVVVYLWTLNILSNLQRITISATVSHWYFYRKSTGTFSPAATFSAATHHALTTMFGTVCFSSFVTLMIRLPLLILPSRIASFAHLLCFNIVASPIAALSDPLAVTYGSIHSLPLVHASRQINQMKLVSIAAGAGAKDNHTRNAYRLAKMLLHAARWMTSLALGLGAWVRTAHITNGGSLYGYVVGLLAGTIGWTILGTAERSLANIVDACLICAASDNSNGRYCQEAQMAFDGF
ncbi:hypothetical protein TWF679_002451 [Orbilia oligospora]|uniref:Protein PNS1 n=1 Tax=Orbilia oligospora TaxID=2813651 RepID=A0A8H8UTL2_ORBOL|nr:hypothetical protein TWF679_002451 [Orbilia oligospora]